MLVVLDLLRLTDVYALRGSLVFWVATVVTVTCGVVSIAGLVVARRDGLAELGLGSLFFLAVSVLPMAHIVGEHVQGGVTTAVLLDRTTVAAAFWSVPVGLAAMSPLLLRRFEVVHRLLVHWWAWTVVWTAVIVVLAVVVVNPGTQLWMPASGSPFAVVRAVVCFALCIAVSIHHLRLAQLARSTGALVVSMAFLMVGCSSLRWIAEVPFSAGWLVESAELVLAVQVGVVIAALTYGRRRAVRDVLRPVTVWDPLLAFEVGLDPAVLALVADLQRKDPVTRDHVVRTSALAIEVARRMSLPYSAVREVGFAALLHDVGKLEVPDHILKKPGELTAEEWEVMKAHAECGGRILADSPVLAPSSVAVRSHHERWDGNGYPDAIAGPEIPEVARIVAVCDAVDAMTFARPYREAMGVERVREILRSGAAGQWDPEVVDVMDRYLAGLDALPGVRLLNGSAADEGAELEFCVPADPRPVAGSDPSGPG